MAFSFFFLGLGRERERWGGVFLEFLLPIGFLSCGNRLQIKPEGFAGHGIVVFAWYSVCPCGRCV